MRVLVTGGAGFMGSFSRTTFNKKICKKLLIDFLKMVQILFIYWRIKN